jgi:hypothetical protein
VQYWKTNDTPPTLYVCDGTDFQKVTVQILGAVLVHAGVCLDPTNKTALPTPTSGVVVFCDSTNSDHPSWEDTTGVVYDLVGISTLTGDVTATGSGSVASTVVKIQGRAISSNAPTNLDVLQWIEADLQWEPKAPTGGSGSSGVGRLAPTVAFASAILDGTCAENTFTWTGVATTDTIVAGWPAALPAGLIGNMFVSATNTGTIRLCNLSGGSITPGSLMYNATLSVYNLNGSATINFASIADGECLVDTFALTGAAAGDPVVAGWPSTLETGLFGNMRASATDVVEVRLCNLSGAAVNPASQTFKASIAK